MSKIDYQALREAAERAIPAMERLLMLPVDDDLLTEQELKDYGVDIDALNAFKFLTGPETVLALLDERERNQQYIKRRDQENEEIALTVGKLRVELEEAKSKLNEQREYYEGVISDGSKRIAELEKSEEQLINERDHAESALADMYFATTGDRPEWSNCFSFSDAVDAVVDRIADLEAKQPSPVVPEEKPMPNPLSMYTVDAVAAIAEVRGWNACRAAMLQSQGNCIKDGWISCSERMPNTKTAVLVAVEFDRKGDWRMKWATYIPGHPDANDGWIIPGASWKPSHWMPLPEPPQEVK
ncbi:ead/Ea22-like family protein [Escherichia coli]|uniref:ead/Ea22-like family protein n=2 Tax=Escherichia coli TaxID=562 RepID=UPI00208DC7B9|nr:ead/Ea22-like family protein [Escherichia coli]MDF9069841.1 ead/Ea22-like family protein [Escherichia coli]MDF9077560.1 ead/Ea22-like family protein [Escherichia coli]